MAGLLGPLIGVSSVPLLGPLLGDAPTSTSAVAEPTVAPQPTETGAGVVVVPVPTVSAQPPSAPLPTTNIPTLSTSVVNGKVEAGF